ncbi:MAG: hypothetical protein ABIH80_02150 [Methanobacteriota archaeon]
MTKYDEVTFYEDMGIDITSRRHILIFNSDLLKDQRKTREKLIDITIKELEEENKSLMNAKKSRNLKPTEHRISEILRKRGVQSYIDTKLESINLSGKTGSSISSFNLTYEKNVEAIKKAMLLGMLNRSLNSSRLLFILMTMFVHIIRFASCRTCWI